MKVQRIQHRPAVRRVRFVTAAPATAPAAKAAAPKVRKRFLPYAAVTAGLVAVASVGLFGFTHYRDGSKPSLDASLTNIPFQTYALDAGKGDVINGREGLILAFPEGAFIDEMGNSVSGQVQVRIKEARDMKDILKGNLTTRTDGNTLATDGMYYLEATQGGKSLKVNPSVGVYAYFPTSKKDGDMNLYAGESEGDGLNWKLLPGKERSIPQCDRDEESRRKCKRCDKLARMSKKIKVGKAPTSANQYWEDRYYWQDGKLMFASSGSARQLFTQDELKDCEEYLKATEKGQELLAKVDRIRKEQEANSPEYYAFRLNNFGWYNIDKLVKEEVITFSGRVTDQKGRPVENAEVHLICKDAMRKIHTSAKAEGGSFQHSFAKDVEFTLFVQSGSQGGMATFTVGKDGTEVGDIQVKELDLATVDNMLNEAL